MKKNNQKRDSWSLLASELGLENKSSEPIDDSNESLLEETVQDFSASKPEEAEKTEPRIEEKTPDSVQNSKIEEPVSFSFGAGILNDEPPQPAPAKEPKKTLLGRFAKINLFGTPKDSSAGTSTAHPSSPKSGSFTSKTLEKVPVPPSRSSKSSSTPSEEKAVSPTQTKIDEEPQKAEEHRSDKESALSSIADSLDPWSKIASQVGALPLRDASGERKSSNAPISEKSSERQRPQKDKNRKDKRRGYQEPPSMFDDVEPSVNLEGSALKNLIDQSETEDEAEKRLKSIFNDDNFSGTAPSRKPERSSRQREQKRPARSEWKEENFESRPSDENRPKGQRGSRYVPDAPKEVSSFREETEEDVFAAWDIEEESKPVERSSRGSRRRGGKTERPEKFEKTERDEREDRFEQERKPRPRRDNDSDRLDDVSTPPKAVPSWNDAISVIIEANQARHAQKSGDSRKGRR